MGRIPGDHFDELLKVGAQRASDAELESLERHISWLEGENAKWQDTCLEFQTERDALRAKLAEVEGHLSRIAEWSQEQQDKLDLDTAIAMWRGCVGEANMALAAIREEKP